MPYFNIYKYGDIYKIIWFNELQEEKLKHDEQYIKDIENGVKAYNVGGEEFETYKEKQKEIVLNLHSQRKRENNIIRAKSKVIEYALCNEWEYFVTLTIDEKKQDRYDLDGYIKALGDWIGNYNKKYGTNLKYLFIPEAHKDGAIHIHGFFMGVADESLVVNKNGYLDLPYYFNRFGYISLDKIRNKDAASFYITKYITKDMTFRSMDIGKHLYYISKGLKHKELYLNGDIRIDNKYKRAFYSNEYVNILWCDKVPDLIADKFKDKLENLEDVTDNSNDYYVNRSYRSDKGYTDI